MAIADVDFKKENLPGTNAALRLESDSPEYYVRLSDLLKDTDPPQAAQVLQRAVALNPWDSQSWVKLGLLAESGGDFPRAEQYLLRAARFDKQYLPSWSLANYYFRRGDSEKFWLWVGRATDMAYGDMSGLFNLCWDVSRDGVLIEEKLDIRRPDVEVNYLRYLTAMDHVEAMEMAASRVLRFNREEDTPALVTACDRLVKEGHASGAIQIWNKLCGLHRIPYGTLSPASGESLTNGDFTVPPAGEGFDWKILEHEGVSTLLEDHPAAFKFQFFGNEPESCDLFVQWAPVKPESDYRLRFLYRTAGIAPGTGLSWRVTDAGATKSFARLESLSSETEREDEIAFRTPAGVSLIRLALSYQRALGTTRIEGSLVLRKVRLILAGAGAQP